MQTRYENIPAELKKLKQWVCWAGDKLPKNPYTGGNAQSNNASTWGDFDTACEAVEKFNFEGIGFMFAQPYFGVDLDKCIDNSDFLDEFVETLRSYTEISKSGNGIHIICKGELPQGARRRGSVEMYCERRYFIVTGNIYNAKYTKVVDCSDTIKPLYAKYLADNTPKVAPRAIEPINFSDEEVIDKARSCKTGGLFQLLYSGQWQGIYGSQSEADIAFCNQLAFWTGRNSVQMDRIFRTSGLMRKKWDERRGSHTYGEITVEKAVTTCQEVYQPKLGESDMDIALGVFRGGTARVDKPTNVYDMTDTGNAQRFRDKYCENIRYSFVNKRWYYWTGKVWTVDQTGEIKKLADTVIMDIKKEAFGEQEEDVQEAKLKWANRTASSKAKESMIKEAQHLQDIPVLPEEMDSVKDYLNCQNGIVNLRNGELMPHTSASLMSKIAYCEYDQSGREPTLWLSFLDDITNGDKELQHYLQKCVGYSLTGSIVEQCAFFLYGIGNNGKSTFLDTVSDLLGRYASNVQPETVMLKRSGDSGANSDIARLKSARFVTSEEPTEGVRLNEGLVKQLTGGGKVTCRFLYGDEFEYQPEFKLWMATNHKPIIRGTDDGIWRRIRLIPFEVSIPKSKVDKHLKWKLRKEFPQIMHWAVEGCIAWQREGLDPPMRVRQATNEYKSEMDVLSSFLEACITIDYNSIEMIPASDLFSVYTSWARNNKEFTMSSRKFGTEIAKKLPDKKRIGSGIVYPKIRFTEEGKHLIQSSRTYRIDDFE